LLVMVPVNFSPSGTGLKSRDAARVVSASRSCPAALKRSRATSSVIQPAKWSAGAPGLFFMNEFSPPQELETTFHPYPAAGVVWMRMTPAAFFAAPISYL
jgi:hypothetical protein